MSIHTLYLDGAIVASVAYPAGVGYSLYTSLWGTPRQISSGLLAMLALPCALVVPAVYALRPELIVLSGATLSWLAAAVAVAPLALASETLIHGAVLWRTTGRRPRGITVQSFWRPRLTGLGHLLLALVAIGEELFYRAIWMGLLISMGVAVPLALVISSAAYGLNHLSFGLTSVAAKSVTGFLYGAVYLAGGQSLALPIVAHVLQNIAVLEIARPRHD
jgi:hypothetical protein